MQNMHLKKNICSVSIFLVSYPTLRSFYITHFKELFENVILFFLKNLSVWISMTNGKKILGTLPQTDIQNL